MAAFLEMVALSGRGSLERLPEALTALTMFVGSGVVSTRYWMAPRLRQAATVAIVTIGTGVCVILSRDPSKWLIYPITGLFPLVLALSATSIYEPRK